MSEFLFCRFVPEDKCSDELDGDEVIRLCNQLPGQEPTQVDGERLLANQHLIRGLRLFLDHRHSGKVKRLLITGWRLPSNSRMVASLFCWSGEGGGEWLLEWVNIDRSELTNTIAVRISCRRME